jgi:hypothetical protein
MWLKADVPAGNIYLFNKGSYYATYEIGGSGNVMRFYVTDGSVAPFFGATASVVVSKFFSVSDPGGEIFNNNPTHLVFTYDGLASGSADINQTRKGTKIFINGARDTTTSHSNGDLLPPYSGMVPDFSQPLCIGTSGSDGTVRTLDGQIAEFAVWEKELTDEEVKAIYNATRKPQVASGIDTNPARILLQERDNATGSYPTIARTGDPDFTGQYASTFDDTNTIIFGGGNLVYPTNLPASSKFVSGGVATPNILQGLTAAGTSSAGTADAHVSFTPGENISPFDESRIYIDNDAEFYATGTASGTLPGFSQRLSSKTSFTIDINPTTSTDVVFSTGTLPNASGYDEGVNSGIAYFNFADKRWEVIGDLTTGSNVDYFNDALSVMTASMLASIGSQFWWTNAIPDPRPFNETIGGPSDLAGFPYATKFNATGSQLFDASSVLTAPFLLEKISIEFSGTMRTDGFQNSARQIMNSSFVLLLQREQNIESSDGSSIQILSGTASPYLLLTSQSNFDINKDRRIISYGRIGKFYAVDFPTAEDLQQSSPETYAAADLWISGGTTNAGGDVGGNAVTGKFTLNFVPKVAAISPRSAVSYASRLGLSDNYAVYLGRQKSGRDLRDQSDGRSFVKSVVGNKIVSSSNTTATLDSGEPVALLKYENESEESPFVLLPDDKLILAHVNQNWPFTFPAFPGIEEGNFATTYKNTLSPGAGKITLFGSLLQNNLPKESETNQPLTSDAIHEDLHYDNPVYDQWDVEPFTTLTGSYTDLVITGSILAQNSSGEYADPEAPNVRKVQASVAAGQAGTTGSLQRFVRLTAQEGKVYDSYPPNAVEIIQGAGFGLSSLAIPAGTTLVSVGAPSSILIDTYGILSGVDSDWYMRHAYEISSQRFLRDSFKNVIGPAFAVDNTAQGIKEVNFTFTAGIYFSGTLAGGGTLVGDGFGNSDNAESFKNTQKYLFGFGDQAYNLPSPILPEIGGTSAPLIRGYKYGLGGLFGSLPDARFRRDRYGQFRDMLEQRRFPATLVGGIVEYPVEIKFVPQDLTTGGSEDPARTHSQNLSPFATSSLPYYDGQVKDRGDDPDVTLTPIEVSV